MPLTVSAELYGEQVPLAGHVEQPDAGARVEPGVAVRERRQRVHEVLVVPEVATVFQVRGRHLQTLRGGLAHRSVLRRRDLGGIEGVGEQPLVAVGLLFEVGGHTRSENGYRGKGFEKRRRSLASRRIASRPGNQPAFEIPESPEYNTS